MTTIRLMMPPAKLSPNGTRNRMERHRLAQKYKSDCFHLARGAGVRPISAEGIKMTLTFHPATNRRRDLDNLIAAFKSGQDGLSLAFDVDDSLFDVTHILGDVTPGGAVIVEVSAR